MPKETEYEVGYKKPPLSTRFKPGQSGNPTGRPKRKGPTYSETLERELNLRIPVKNGQKQQTIPVHVAIVKKQIHKALSGDSKAIASFMQFMERHDSAHEELIVPILDAMRAIHAKHEAAGPNGSPIIETARREQPGSSSRNLLKKL